jgi:hypothetical protein
VEVDETLVTLLRLKPETHGTQLFGRSRVLHQPHSKLERIDSASISREGEPSYENK